MKTIPVVLTMLSVLGTAPIGVTAQQAGPTTQPVVLPDQVAAGLVAMSKSRCQDVQTLAHDLAECLTNSGIQAPKLAAPTTQAERGKLADDDRALVKKVCLELLSAFENEYAMQYRIGNVLAQKSPDTEIRGMALYLFVVNPAICPAVEMPEPAKIVQMLEDLVKADESAPELVRKHPQLFLLGAHMPYLLYKVMALDPLNDESFRKLVDELLMQAAAIMPIVEKESDHKWAESLNNTIEWLKEQRKEPYATRASAAKAALELAKKHAEAESKRDLAGLTRLYVPDGVYKELLDDAKQKDAFPDSVVAWGRKTRLVSYWFTNWEADGLTGWFGFAVTNDKGKEEVWLSELQIKKTPAGYRMGFPGYPHPRTNKAPH